MNNFTPSVSYLFFTKSLFSIVLLFWAVQNVSHPSGIERLELLFTPLRQAPLAWALVFSSFQIAIVIGLWFPKWQSLSFGAVGFLLLGQLVVGIINLRLVQASSCPAPGFLEGNPYMILVQQTALLLIIAVSFLIKRKDEYPNWTSWTANFG